MRFGPIVLIVAFFLLFSVDGLELKTTAHVIGGGVMYAHTQSNGFEDFVNGSGEQMYVRSLSCNGDESSLSSNYEYKRDMSKYNGSNTHYAGIKDEYVGIEHYVSTFSVGSVTSNAMLKKTDGGIETSFVSNSDDGSLVEGVISTGKIGPAYNCEINDVMRVPMKLAETYLQGQFTFDSKLNEQVAPLSDFKGLSYKIDQVHLMNEYEVIDGQQKIRILKPYAAKPPEEEAKVYYVNARDLFINATKSQRDKNWIEANKSFNLALASITNALDLNPSYYKALVLKGSILIQLNQSEDSLIEFDKALAISRDSDLLRRKGEALSKLENYREASAIFIEALNLDSSNQKAFQGLREVINKIVGSNADSNNSLILFLKGMEQYYEGDMINAEINLESALDNGLSAHNPGFAEDARTKIRRIKESQ